MRQTVDLLYELNPYLSEICFPRRPELSPQSIEISPNMFYREIIQQRLPQLGEQLVTNLAQLTWLRFQNMRVMQERKEENATEPEPLRKAHTISTFHDSAFYSLGTTYHHSSARSEASATSFATTTADEESLKLMQRLPKPPVDNLADTPSFTCNICHRKVSGICSRRRWRDHVFSDLQAYSCIYGTCDSSRTTFSTRRSWTAHIFSHDIVREWKCFCSAASFTEKSQFISHVLSDHLPGTADGHRDIVEEMASRFERITSTEHSDKLIHCPCCNAIIESSKTKYGRHVGRHLEDIALLALPSQYETIDEVEAREYSDDDEDSSQQIEIPLVSEFWKCSGWTESDCTEICYREEDFIQHLLRTHNIQPFASGLIVKACHQKSRPFLVASTGKQGVAVAFPISSLPSHLSTVSNAGPSPETKDTGLPNSSTHRPQHISAGETKLHRACRLGLADDVEFILSGPGKMMMNVVNDAGYLPIHQAAHQGHLEVLKLLISHGSPFDALTTTGNDTPLMIATLNDRHEVLEYLSRLMLEKLTAERPHDQPETRPHPNQHRFNIIDSYRPQYSTAGSPWSRSRDRDARDDYSRHALSRHEAQYLGTREFSREPQSGPSRRTRSPPRDVYFPGAPQCDQFGVDAIIRARRLDTQERQLQKPRGGQEPWNSGEN